VVHECYTNDKRITTIVEIDQEIESSTTSTNRIESHVVLAWAKSKHRLMNHDSAAGEQK